jgi:hypothetical protein
LAEMTREEIVGRRATLTPDGAATIH